jgi:hypothetical protein
MPVTTTLFNGLAFALTKQMSDTAKEGLHHLSRRKRARLMVLSLRVAQATLEAKRERSNETLVQPPNPQSNAGLFLIGWSTQQHIRAEQPREPP